MCSMLRYLLYAQHSTAQHSHFWLAFFSLIWRDTYISKQASMLSFLIWQIERISWIEIFVFKIAKLQRKFNKPYKWHDIFRSEFAFDFVWHSKDWLYAFEIESNISELMRRNNVEKNNEREKSVWRLICVVKMSIDADLKWKWFNNKQETNVCNYSCVFSMRIQRRLTTKVVTKNANSRPQLDAVRTETKQLLYGTYEIADKIADDDSRLLSG